MCLILTKYKKLMEINVIMDKKTLYLFDIDGTLSNFLDFHAEAYQYAYKKVLGKTIPKEDFYRNFGIPGLIWNKKLFKEIGCDEKKIPEVYKEYRSYFFNLLDNSNVPLLEGVKEFLDFLKQNKQPLGIVTGNSEDKGVKIIETMKIKEYFQVFSYAVGENPRSWIVEEAISKAKDKNIGFDNVVVIGDTPMDVESGKQTGTLTVAVATGRFSRKQLIETNADLVIDSMTEYMKIVELVQ
jgi:phosphoglycolate phosphatase